MILELSARPRHWSRATLAVAVSTVLIAAGCGGDDDSEPASGLSVTASFYPLQFAAERVGGEVVDVTNLTPPGVEPHELELMPQDTGSLEHADLVIFLSGFAPAVDDAVASFAADRQLDVADAARLDLDGGEDHEEGEEHAGGEDHGHAEDGDHDHGGVDPHFWLDPTRLADVADAIAARFGELRPDQAADFTANAAALRGELEALDGEYETGLASCANTDIVTSHEAFGYLAQRYGLTQVGIAGVSPDAEPSPAELAEVTEFVRANDVSTIYYETLVDPAIAQTVAGETGADTAVLDPIEGLTDGSAGADYFEVMRSNLEALRTGQSCA